MDFTGVIAKINPIYPLKLKKYPFSVKKLVLRCPVRNQRLFEVELATDILSPYKPMKQESDSPK
jgi:hypothetical protein